MMWIFAALLQSKQTKQRVQKTNIPTILLNYHVSFKYCLKKWNKKLMESSSLYIKGRAHIFYIVVLFSIPN